MAETQLKEWNKRGCQMAREVVVGMASESSDEHEKLQPKKTCELGIQTINGKVRAQKEEA